MSITADQLLAAYNVAKDVFEGRLTARIGVEQLHVHRSLNLATAKDLISNFAHMMNGQRYTRSLSAEATNIYLERIEVDFGTENLKRAVSAAEQHIEYYEALPLRRGRPKGNLNTLRATVSKFAARCSSPTNFDEYIAEFTKDVAHAMHMSPAARRAMLRKSLKLPTKRQVSTFVFNRSPYVVAEVLSRASGACEQCKEPAPFNRKTDGMPYLEVHHVKHLANGGEDTVENAIALCPNCHRWAHHGTTNI